MYLVTSGPVIIHFGTYVVIVNLLTALLKPDDLRVVFPTIVVATCEA
jgi:hypothetical protein